MIVHALRKLLSACALNKSSRLEDAPCVCLKLNEPSVSFSKFDAGEVGRVDCNDLLDAFNPGGEEQTTRLLRELEKKMQQDLREQTIQEELQRLQAVVASMQRHHNCEMNVLQAVVDRLRKENAQLKNSLNDVNISRGRGNLNECSCGTDSSVFRMELRGNQNYSHTSREPTKQTNEINYLRSSSIGLSSKMNNSLVVPRQRLHLTWPADEELTPLETSSSESNSEDLDASGDLHTPEVPDGSEDFVETIGDHRLPEAKLPSRVRLNCKRLLSIPSKLEDASFSEIDDPTYKLILAGDSGSGKSCFLLRLSTHTFKKDPPTTVGVDCKVKKMVVDGKQTTLHIWDTAGQERFRSLTRSYFHNIHGIFLFYDITCKSSFLNIRHWMDQIEESVDSPVPMCIIGNKADLRSDLPDGSCVSTAQGEKLAKVYNTLFCETSAKDGTNVVEAVLHLAREVKKSTRPAQTVGETSTLTSCCWM